MRGVGHRVAHTHVERVLEACHHVADLADAQVGQRRLGRAAHADLLGLEDQAARHETHALVGAQGTVDDTHERHDAAIRVEVGVEDQRFEGCVGVADRSGDVRDNGLEQLMDAVARLARDAHSVVAGNGEAFLDLVLGALDIGRRQVDLVDCREDLKAGVHGEKGVGHRLRLDALRGVDHEHRALACGKRTGHLVGEVNVTRGVDEVELVALTIVGHVLHAHGLALDGDAALALDVHRVEQLSLHVAMRHGVRLLENAVGHSRFAVVDMGDDGEVSDVGSVVGSHTTRFTSRLRYKKRAPGTKPDALSTCLFLRTRQKSC